MVFNRRILILLSILIGSVFICSPLSAKKKIKKIVLDAGHGGKDAGCHGVYSFEKDITLAVTLKLGKMLETEYKKDLEVMYTRTYDIYPPSNAASKSESLIYRTEMANKGQGDVFISIHVNSTPRRNSPVKGTLILVCGPTRVDEKEGAIGENTSNFVENDILDPNDPTTAIIIAQYSQAFLSKSITLGEKINNEFIQQGRVTEGVRQQSLQVLASSAMPGILVEIGYLNNTDEENYLNSEEGQNEVAMAIFNGIKRYKEELEKDPVEIKVEN